MTAAQIQAKLDALNHQIADLTAESLTLAAQLDVVLAKEAAASKVAAMSDEEKAALAEALAK